MKKVKNICVAVVCVLFEHLKADGLVFLTRGWISFNMKAFFFSAVCNPTEGNDDGKSKVKRKSYGGQRERENEKENRYQPQRRSLRGVSLVLFEPAPCSYEELLGAAEGRSELWEE